ncbi:hypothetical protein EGW08_019267, partial [Elysia chlorotica]
MMEEKAENPREKVSLALTDAKRKDQGHVECEVWAEGHEGSKNWKTCTKNPGHLGFTPASQFSVDLVPSPYNQDPEVFQLIQLQIELTVRLRVHFTSNARPDGYTFSKFKGQHVPHTGSGIIVRASYRFPPAPPEDKNYEACPCQVCCDAAPKTRRKQEWWSIEVRTAKHVVYDTDEAKDTIADLFLDQPGKMTSQTRLYGMNQATSHFDGDIARILLATHDEELGQRLSKACKHFDILSMRML